MIKQSKTISALNEKLGYRALKVIYCGIVGIIGFIIIAIYRSDSGPRFDNTNSYIQCNNGDQYNLEKNGIYLHGDYYIPQNDQTFNQRCKKSGYTLVPYYTTRDRYASISFIVWTIVIIALATEVFRRITYYIMLGSFTPDE